MSALAPIVAFDLDDTLAPSKSALDPEMAAILAELVAVTDVAVISGGQFSQFESQLLAPLAQAGAVRPTRLHVLPACGTQYYRFTDDGWERVYVEALSPDERSRAFAALEQAARTLGLWSDERAWGPIIEDRESQVTFSALGQQAPIAEKEAWDPDGTRKHALREAVAALLPGLEVRTGGTTSLDVTRRGRDKAYGIGRLCAQTGLDRDDILFFGDQLQPGGNDNPVLQLGVACIAVTQWRDTADHLRARLDQSADVRSGNHVVTTP
ncbi:HAD-IIB family hydrolase [Microbacterium sp. CIAB417]|uniref:HAD-IIB family hydrolase n=1 Tax=Microbacterium sp. CIAB417 TaxID=2860287 RepID=UPI001FAC7C1A|nr:HAD-IIB family hydrolase [Microbacterium sp. CIAB417]